MGRIHGPYASRRPDMSWRDGPAACAGMDPDLFFPVAVGADAAAKDVCATCPLIGPCLDHALRFDERGVWGGTNEDERKALRNARRTA